MPDTTNYGWTYPTVGGNADTWGTVINTAFQAIDTSLKAVEDQQLQIDQVELYGSLLHVVAPKIEQYQMEVVQILEQAGIHMRSMAVIEPSLEDVFISSMK